MKKLISVILIISTLFLCACSNKSDAVPTTTKAETTAATTGTTAVSTTQKPVEYFENWNSELIPKNFPSPPEKAHSLKISSGKASETSSGYRSDWIRISFVCSENDFFSFAKQFEDNGYIGGFKNFQNAVYYNNGFTGYWQDGKNIVKINNTKITENYETRFTIDVIECRDNFPLALTEFFPKFEGYTITEGSYCGHNEDGENETKVFKGIFSSTVWHWEFRFEESFVGVEQSDFEDYCNLLGKQDFVGPITASEIDGTSAVSVDLVKETDSYSYGAFLLYNQTLKTLDIAYTNDSSLFIEE